MRSSSALKTLCATCAPPTLLHAAHFLAVPLLMAAAPATANAVVNTLSGDFARVGMVVGSGVLGGLMQQFMDRAAPPPSPTRAIVATAASAGLAYGIGCVLPQYEMMQMCQSAATFILR